MWFILALTALLFWSGSDLFSKIGSKPDDKYSHHKMVMAVGLVMGIHAIIEICTGTKVTLNDIITYLPASLLYISSMILGYVGLRYIELSVSSPICNSSGAIASLLCFFFLNQRVEKLSAVAIAVICIGVVALGITEYTESDEARLMRSTNIKYTKSILAIMLPVLYCILDAFGTFADAVILETLNEDTANVAYELTFLLSGIISAIYVLGIKKEKFTFKRETPKLVGAVCETAGQFAYVYAISANAVSAAPVISAYCAASVLWSRIFLKEKLSFKHYIAIAVTVAGIVMLGISEGA